MRRQLLAIALVSIGSVAALHAQEHPVVQTGFAPDKVYNFFGIDSVNTFNGNLTIQLPIGFKYPLNGGLSYGLTLSYNSKVWSYSTQAFVCGGGPICPPFVTRAQPSVRSNAGLGWVLSMGRFVPPEDPLSTHPNGGYQTPDGATHAFYKELHPGERDTPYEGKGYTRDNTYMRTNCSSTGCVVNQPDGTIHTFAPDGALLSIRDQFGNGVNIRTIVDEGELGGLQQCRGTAGRTQSHPLSSAWEVTDDENRKHYVCFTSSPRYENIYGNQLVYRVVMEAPGNGQAEYDFWYSIPVNALAPDGFGVLRGCRSTVPNDDLYPNVPLLDRLILPDGSQYSATYSAGGSCSQGSLTSLALPTGGKIEYTYRYWELPISRCDVPAGDWRDYSSGVATRQIIDGATNPIWVYDTVHGTPPPGNHACGWFGGDRSAPITRPNPRETDTTLLRSPDGTLRKYWYSVWPYSDASPNGFVFKEFSLPLTRLPLQGANPRGNLFLSTETYDRNGTKLRSAYSRYEYAPIRCEDFNIGTPPSTFETNPSCLDSNRRVVEEQTVYDADGGRASSTTYSDFDGFGHYRQTETTGTFGGDTTRTSVTNFNPGTDALGKRNGQFAFGDDDPWLLNTFDSQTVEEGQQWIKTEFHFDAKGSLERQRTLRNFGDDGSFTRDKNDLLTVFTRDQSSGNITATSYYGGDCLDEANCSQDLGLGGLSTLSLPDSPAYEIRHTYSHGVRATSTYHDDDSPVLKFLDRSIDSSGAVICEKDTAGLATCFTYDSMGRVRSVAPPGGAVTAYVYTNADASSPAEVAVSRGDTSTIFQFDPVGRLWREKRLMPDGSTSIQETRYDALGNKDYVSEFEKLLVEESIFVPADRTDYDYDPFGRLERVRAPDGSVTQFAYTGHGERETKRTSRFWTGNAVGTATVTEEYDVFRRLVKVTEQSGKPTPTNPDGSEVETTYGYDVANRLTSVMIDDVQPRTFDYDGRGFLKEETHPETSGTTYDLYDARGHARRQTTAGRTLAFDYDLAERLVGVSERQGTTETPLKTFKFGEANAANNYKKGKLESATRHNETAVAGQVDVTESYEYAPPSGQMSKRTTTIERVDTVNGQTVRTPIKTLEYKTDYDALLLPRTITFPTCDGCTTEDGIARATNTRTAGYLTAVDGFGSLTYHPSGMVETVMHGTRNKAVDTYGQRNNMARPSKITFAGCGDVTPYFLPGPVLAKATTENNSCGLQVTWPSAVVCGGVSNIKYTVLRDNVPVASCLTEPKYIDRSAAKGATYTYTIVAESGTVEGGTGSCQGGKTVRRDSKPTSFVDCPAETLLSVKDTVINVGVSTEFEATLESVNGPVQDEFLIFSVLGQTIGTARTNANGKAFVSAILDVEPRLYDEADSLTVTYAGGIMPAKTVSKQIRAVCTTRSYSIAPLALNVMAHAASYPIFVRTSNHCSWDPSLGLFAFYTFNPDDVERKGTGTFDVEIQKLEGTGARHSEAQVAGQKLKIEQSSECNYQFDPQFNYFQADTFFGRATATIKVSAPPDCKWKVRSDADWILVDSTTEHTGTETIEFQYTDNEGINKRVGHLLIDAGEGASAFINQYALPESICPEIHRDIEGGSVQNGQNVAMRVDAGGTFLHYEWWINDRREYECRGCSTLTLAPGMDGYPAPGETSSFQVRIFNTCGEVASRRVTWSNQGQSCRVPSIADSTFHTNAWPPDRVVGSSGSRTTLRVVGDGWPDPNPVKYQWYAGFSGDRDHPLTSTQDPEYGKKDEVEVGPGFYWVEVTNNCGSNQSRTAQVFVFVPPSRPRPVSHSLDGDSYSDVVWQNPATSQVEIWKMNEQTYDNKTYALPNAPTSTAKLQSVGDLNADGHPDLIWRDPATGQNSAWMMRYTTVQNVVPLEERTDKRWTIGAVADFDGDNHDDVAWHNAATGGNEIWFHRGTEHEGTWALPNTSAGIHGAADFNGDEVPDLFLHDRTTGQNNIWAMSEGKPIGTFSRFGAGTDSASRAPEITTHALPPMTNPDWIPAFVADMDGNGRPDILWRNTKTGENKVWIMNFYMFQEEKPATPRDTAWDIAGGGSSNSGDTSGGTPGGGTTTSLQLGADPAPVGTATVVTATLKAGTTPIAQRVLVFYLNNAEVTRLRTDAAGQATAVITVAGMAAGTYPNAIKVNFDGDTTYSGSTASTNLVIRAQPVTVTWLNPAPIVYGTPLGAAQLNATASAAGTFSYSPPGGTVLGAGYQTLAVTFTPSDTSLAPVTKNAVLLVTKAPTSVTWIKPEEIAYGVPLSDEQLNATASVPGSFEYDPPAGSILPVGSAQQLKVVFEPESPNYDKSSGSTTIDVTKGSQLVQWTDPAPILFGAPLGSAQLNASVIPSGTAPAGAMTYDPPAGTILTEGVHELKVTVAETASYNGASATVDIIVRASNAIVTWAPPAPITYGTPLSVAQLNATASMGGTVQYDPAPGTILNSGTHTLTARFTPTDPRYQPVSVSVSLEVKKVKSEIVWPHPVPISYGTPLSSTELSAVATAPGQIVFSPALGTILDAGRYTLSATFTPSDPLNYESASASVLLDVSRAPQVITWSAPAAIVYGTPLSSTQLNATVPVVGPSPAGAITYSPAAGTILGAGPAQTLTVSVAATPNYEPATKSVTIDVLKADPKITWVKPAGIVYGTPIGANRLNATADVSGTFVYTPPAGTILDAGPAQTLAVHFTPTDTRNYNDADASVTIDVAKAEQLITWPQPTPIVYGTPLSATQLNATVTVVGPSPAGGVTYSPAAGTVLQAGAGQVLSVSVAATSNYNAASKTVTLDVLKATPVLTWPQPEPIVYKTLLSATQLNATADVPGSFTYMPAAGTLLEAGLHTLTAQFTPNDTRNYNDASTTTKLEVQRADPVLTWAKPAEIVYGTPLSATQLNATADVPGVFVYTPAAGTILNAGAGQTLSAHFTPSDTRNYNEGDVSTTIDVAKAPQTIRWTAPSPIVYGAKLSATQLNATVEVVGPAAHGALTYTPPAGTALDAGLGQVLSVAVAETPNYLPASKSVTLDVLRAPLSLVVHAKSKLYGDAVPALTGVLTGVVNNDPITPSYATTATQQSVTGTYPITATLVDPNNRLVNYDVTITPSTLTVLPAPLTIAAVPASKQYSDPLPQLTATFTGLVLGETPAVLSGVLSIQTTAERLSAPGTYPITIGGLTSTNYVITYVGSTFTVTPEDARVVVISPRLVSAASTGATTVMLAATVQDISATAEANGDVDAGDIRNATVTFVDRATNATLCTAPIGLTKPSDLRTGVLTCTFTRDFGTTLPASLVVGTRVSAYYTRDAAADDVTMSIVASTADFITGAGAFDVLTTAGPNAPDLNSEGKFELNMQYQKAGDLRGRFSMTFNRTEAGAVRKYELAIVTPTSMTIQRATGGGTTTIIGTASITDVSARSVVVTAAPIVLVATDAGEPGTNDAVSITIYNPAGGVWFATGWNGLQATGQLLKNGNLTVVQRAK